MNTVVNYIELRGDLSPMLFPYNEVDYLIFSMLSYIDFDDFLDHPCTLEEAYILFKNKHLDISKHSFHDSYHIFELMYQCKRYRHIKIIDFINEKDKELIKQFSALSLLFEDQRIHICFRGTDDSFIGWHEDFLMVYNNCIEAQKCALNYVHKISSLSYNDSLYDYIKNHHIDKNIFKRIQKYFSYKKHRPIILSGHSKGGNLAMYAGVFAHKEIKDNIKTIYNFDGPGFLEDVVQSREYKENVHKIISYVPHYSLFGILFEHDERRIVVQSRHKGILQHQAISWIAGRDGFIRDELSLESQMTIQKIENLLDSLSAEKKELFISDLFNTLDKLELEDTKAFSNVSYKHIINVIKEFSSIDASSRKTILELIYIVYEEFQKAKKEHK